MRDIASEIEAENKSTEDTKTEVENNDKSVEETVTTESGDDKGVEPKESPKNVKKSNKSKDLSADSKSKTVTDTTDVDTEQQVGFTKVDPNNLSEELKPIYKQMQADYTRKTQEIAKLREEYEKVQRYIPLLNQVLSKPELLNQALGTPSQGQEQEQEEIPTDPKEFADWVSNKTAEKIRAEIAEREKIRAEQEALQREYQEAEKLDPRLSEDPKFQDIIVGMVAQDPDFISRKINAVEATRRAIETYDAYMEEVIKSHYEKQKDKVSGKKHVIKEGQSNTKTVSPEVLSSMREIAKKEGFIS